MLVKLSALLLLGTSTNVHGFSAPRVVTRSAVGVLNVAAGPPSDDEAAPKLFSDDLLTDMQQCLLTLERRVQEGPGALTHADIDVFARASARILGDMKNDGISTENRIQPGERQARADAAAVAAAQQAELEGKSTADIEILAKAAFDAANLSMIPAPPAAEKPAAIVVPPPVAAAAPVVVPPPVEPVAAAVVAPTPTNLNENDEPAYDGSGFGVAKGTANTYIIDGMDEMTADEYQTALALEVVERARKRRYGLKGAAGNRQSLDYMNSLGGGQQVNHFNMKDDGTPGDNDAAAKAVAYEKMISVGTIPQQQAAAAPVAPVVAAAPVAVVAPPVVVAAAVVPPPVVAPTPVAPTPTNLNENDEPAYDGSGFGVAKGTANTYIIDGMDEMTADEYQAALALEVVERARKRRYGLKGAAGNRQSLDYMNSLGGGQQVNHFNMKDDGTPGDNDAAAKAVAYEKMISVGTIPQQAAAAAPVVAAAPAPVAASEVSIDAQGHISPPPPPFTPAAVVPPPVAAAPVAPTPTNLNENDEPAYDGSGFGVAKGTANTYIIDGMDEMTADEYQAALALEVVERARKRRYGLKGAAGNRQSLDYMNSLGGGQQVNHFNMKDDGTPGDNDAAVKAAAYEKMISVGTIPQAEE